MTTFRARILTSEYFSSSAYEFDFGPGRSKRIFLPLTLPAPEMCVFAAINSQTELTALHGTPLRFEKNDALLFENMKNHGKTWFAKTYLQRLSVHR